MSKKHLLHKLMEARFGERACEASHKWLRSQVGKSHVAECDERELAIAISAIRRIKVVRNSVWNKLDRERGVFKKPVSKRNGMTLAKLSKDISIPLKCIKDRMKNAGMDVGEDHDLLSPEAERQIRECYDRLREHLQAPKAS
jgi:hypothetical protein